MLSELFAPIVDFITAVIIKFNYFGIALSAFLENVVAPIPSEFVFPWAGFLASQGKLNIFLIALSGAIGSVLAGLVLYYLGYKFNGPKSREFVDKYGRFLLIKLEDLEKAEKWFEKYGPLTVFFFRFVPIARSLISIPAGFVKMNVVLFAVLTFVGTFIWSFALTYAGYLLGSNWSKIEVYMNKYQNFAILAVIILGLFFVYKNRGRVKDIFVKKPKEVDSLDKNKTEEKAEL